MRACAAKAKLSVWAIVISHMTLFRNAQSKLILSHKVIWVMGHWSISTSDSSPVALVTDRPMAAKDGLLFWLLQQSKKKKQHNFHFLNSFGCLLLCNTFRLIFLELNWPLKGFLLSTENKLTAKHTTRLEWPMLIYLQMTSDIDPLACINL